MTRNEDDRFRPRPGRIRSQGGARSKSFLNSLLHQVSAVQTTGAGVPAAKAFTGRRIGRGNNVLRRHRAGHRFGSASRRVVIKSRIVKLTGQGSNSRIAAARAHLGYLQRDGVTKEQEPGRLYDAASDQVDSSQFLERSDGDRHQFRFIVSPENATEIEDLKPFIRDLMRTMESDLETRLDWVAVDHFNTEHPHTHIVLRGRDNTGKDLVIARDYIGQGMRRRASELLTLELGPQTESEIRHKLERQVEQDRFTDLDRQLVRRADDGVVNLEASFNQQENRNQRAVQIGRLRVLARRGLAKELSPDRWWLPANLETTLRRVGERSDIIKTMHRSLKAAGLDAGATDYAVFDAHDPQSRSVTGLIIDRGLHDELDDGHYVLVDAADGRVYYVSLEPGHKMDDVPIGAVVAIHPANRGLNSADRTIVEIARQNSGVYSPELHRQFDSSASEDYIKAHVRRLESLRRQHIVQRFADGSWQVPEKFEQQVGKIANSQARTPSRVITLSYVSLEKQINAKGATWLDRQLLGKDQLDLQGTRFGRKATEALRQRKEVLIEQGLAKRRGDNIRYRRNLLMHLRQRELSDVGEQLTKETGLDLVQPKEGERIEGVYRRAVTLASTKFAVLEKSKEFTLVPWRAALERHRGKLISGEMRGATLSFEVTKKRGIGIS